MIFDFSSVVLNDSIIYAFLFNYLHESMTHETKTCVHNLTCTSLYSIGTHWAQFSNICPQCSVELEYL